MLSIFGPVKIGKESVITGLSYSYRIRISQQSTHHQLIHRRVHQRFPRSHEERCMTLDVTLHDLLWEFIKISEVITASIFTVEARTKDFFKPALATVTCMRISYERPLELSYDF